MTILSNMYDEIHKNILCGTFLHLEGDDPRRNTYCMRKKGHTGKCNIVDAEPVEKEKVDATKTK